MGSAVTYTYSPEQRTDSGQILRIRGARLELIANVWLRVRGYWDECSLANTASPNVAPARMSYPVRTVLMSGTLMFENESQRRSDNRAPGPLITRGQSEKRRIGFSTSKIGRSVARVTAHGSPSFDKSARAPLLHNTSNRGRW